MYANIPVIILSLINQLRWFYSVLVNSTNSVIKNYEKITFSNSTNLSQTSKHIKFKLSLVVIFLKPDLSYHMTWILIVWP